MRAAQASERMTAVQEQATYVYFQMLVDAENWEQNPPRVAESVTAAFVQVARSPPVRVRMLAPTDHATSHGRGARTAGERRRRARGRRSVLHGLPR